MGAIRFLFLILLLLAGCTGEQGDAEAGSDGRASPERIVSLAPNLTELCFALGIGSRVVGVTDHCDHPAAVEDLPTIGGYNSPSLESILALEPDLVLCAEEGPMQPVVDRLRHLGHEVWTCRIRSLDGLEQSVEELARRVGVSKAGQRLRAKLSKRRRAVADIVSERTPVPAVVVLDRTALILAGPGSFPGDLLEEAGGRNVVADTGTTYPRYSMESLIAAAPQVLIDLTMAEDREAATGFWASWESLEAVQRGAVVQGNPDLLARPGPRLLDGLEWLARTLHPDAFQESK